MTFTTNSVSILAKTAKNYAVTNTSRNSEIKGTVKVLKLPGT